MGSDSKHYAAELSTLGFGLPLWFPERSEKSEALIGDVGVIRGGAFLRLFNCICTADNPLNSGSVPENFVPFPLSESTDFQTDDSFLPTGVICSNSMTRTGYKRVPSAGTSPHTTCGHRLIY